MYFPCSSAPLSQSPCPVSGGLPPVPWHGMYVLRHGMYVPPPGTWVPRPGSRRRPRRVFFFCPLCAVCQPFAFSRKNILKKSAKKFGPYGEVVVPLHPISGKKSRGRERSLEALHGTTTEVQEERDRHWRPFSGRVVRKRLRLGPELCPEIRSERCPVRARHGPRVPGAVQAWQCRPFYLGRRDIFTTKSLILAQDER